MISSSVFFPSLICIASIMVFRCNADQLPPPTDLEFKWHEGFNVMLSWKKPSGLSDNVNYSYFFEKKTQNDAKLVCLDRNLTQYTVPFLTEDSAAYSVWTVSDCTNVKIQSKPAEFQIYPMKPKAVLVKDFKCLIHIRTMNCSWIPANESEIPTLSYGPCSWGSIKTCDQPYRNETTHGCLVSFPENSKPDDICIVMETEKSLSSFKPKLVISPPEVTITKEGSYLKLNLTHNHLNCIKFEVCYKECGKDRGCQETSEIPMISVPYIESCQYEFRSKAMSLEWCMQPLISPSHHLIYGVTKPPDETVIVLTIVIPIVLSFFAILSCYCFRKHSAIFCPVIPEPSVMFKEMMSGNREPKTKPRNMYKPVEEHIESCKIMRVQDSCILQQKS